MITELQGFKGSTRKYTAPVSESAFSGDQLQFFSNLSGSLKDGRQDKMPYKMNMRNGRALEEHDVLHYGDTKRFTQFRKMTYTYDDIETNTSTHQTFDLALPAGYRASAMGTRMKVNGLEQVSGTPWTNESGTPSGVDFFFSTNYRKVHLRKLHQGSNDGHGGWNPGYGGHGVTLIDGDLIEVEHQTEIV